MSLLQRLFADISDVDVAQSDVDSARGRMAATIEEIQSRLAPTNLIEEAFDQMKTRSADLAQSAGQAVRERPATVAVGAAAIGLLLARKPLARLAERFTRKAEETPTRPRRSTRKAKTPQPVSKG